MALLGPRSRSRNTYGLILIVFNLFLTITGLAITLLSVYRIYFALPPNYCFMTYMRPVYEPVSVPSALAYKYRLYRYHEIHHDGTVLSPTSTMEAHPVLFVPGHAGSYKQVRGFASQAAKLIAHTAKPLDHPVDLDVPDSYWKNLVIREEISKLRGVNHSLQAVKPLIFFTLDLSEELSAFRGDLLLNQVHLSPCLLFFVYCSPG